MKKQFLKNKKFVALILFCCLFFLKSNSVNAAMWSNVITDWTIYLNGQLAIQIRISANASAKAFSIKQAQATIQSMLNNGSSKPNFITNYNEFLISSPREKAKRSTQAYMSNFLLKGRFGNGYVKANTKMNEDGITITYEEYLYNLGNRVLDGDLSTVDVMNDCPDLMNKDVRLNGGIFSGGNMNCFSNMFNNPSNNTPIGLVIKLEGIYSQNLQNNTSVAQAQAMASGGFLPKYDENTGNIILPAGSIEELQNKGLTISIDALINANSAEESTAIQAIMTASIPDLINFGLGENQKNAKNSYLKFIANISSVSNINPLNRYDFRTFWNK